MGAFFLFRNGTKDVDPEKADQVFIKKGFIQRKTFSLNEMTLFLYPKIGLPDEKNFHQDGDDAIFATGTILYRNLFRKDILPALLEDFRKDNAVTDELEGNFCILLYLNRKIRIILAHGRFYQVYYLDDNSAISSSFLALVEAFTGKLSIHSIPASLNLITGCSFGKETLFREIFKADTIPGNDPAGSIKWTGSRLDDDTSVTYSSYRKALTDQLMMNRDYFEQIYQFAGEECVDLGLSGGYDSRLLLGLAMNYLDNISIHSNYKDPPDKDLLVSRKLAKIAGRPLVEIPLITTGEMDEQQFFENLNRSMLFYDGQIRVNHGWVREYRTLEYRRKVLDKCALGLSGHNGEQYRNYYYLPGSGIKLSRFIRDYILETNIEKMIPDKQFREELLNYLKDYIRQKTGVEKRNYISFSQIRKYYTMEWVRFGPGIRSSIENQLSYFLMPFTFRKNIQTARNIEPFMDLKGSFQADMIRELNPELASVMSHYGYNFLHVPVKNRIEIMARAMTGKALIKKMKRKIKQAGVIQYPVSQPYSVELLNSTGLPINWEFLRQLNEHASDRMVAFSYLIEKYSHRIKLTT